MSLIDPNERAEEVRKILFENEAEKRRKEIESLLFKNRREGTIPELEGQQDAAENAKVRQEATVPEESLDNAELLSTPGPLSFRELPTTAQNAVNQALQEGIRIPNTPAFAEKIQRFAAGWQYLLLRQEGLLNEKGSFQGEVSDELLDKINRGFLTVGARLLSDLTEEEIDSAQAAAAQKYIDFVKSRAIARRNEVIANHQREKDQPAGPNNLTATGELELGKIDNVFAAMIQMERHKNRDAVIGGFKSLLNVAQAKLINARSVPEEDKQRLRVRQATLRNMSIPQRQDAIRILLSGDPDDHSGPIVQFAKTFQFLEEVTDPVRQFQLVANAYEGAIRETRLRRLAMNPNLNPVGLMYAAHPEVLAEIADTKLRHQVRREVGADDIAFNPNALEVALKLARRQRLPGIIDESAARTIQPIEDLMRLETEATRGILVDLEARTMQALGEIFGMAGETFGPPARFWINAIDSSTRGTPEGHARARMLMRRQRDQMRKRTNNFETVVNAADDQEIEEEAASLNDTALTPEQRQVRMLQARQRGAVRGIYRRDVGVRQREAIDNIQEALHPEVQKRLETQPEIDLETARQQAAAQQGRLLHPNKPEDRIEPLKTDFSNLEEFLEDAAREGEIPWRDARILFTQSGGREAVENIAANMAAMAFNVLAPQSLLRMHRAGMGVPEIRKLFKDAQISALNDKVLPGMSTEGVREVERDLVARLSKMSPLARARPDLVLRLAWTRTVLQFRELGEEFLRNPTQTTDLLFGSLPLAAAAGAAASPAMSRLRNGLVNSAMASRMRRAIADTAAGNPLATKALRETLERAVTTAANSDLPMSRRQRKTLEAMRATADVARTLGDEQMKGTLGSRINGFAPDGRKVEQSALKLRRTLRQLGTEDLASITEVMDIPERARQLIQDVRSPIRQMADAIQERFAELTNIDGLEIRPWVTEAAERFANKVEQAIANGDRIDPEILPIDLSAFGQPGNKAKVIFNTPIAEFFKPSAKKIIDGIGDFTEGVVNYVAKYHDDSVLVNWLQAEGRANMVSFLDFLRNKYVGEMSDLNVALPNKVFKQQLAAGRVNPLLRPLAEELEIQNAKRQLSQRLTRIRRDKQTIDMKGWDEPIRLFEQEYVGDATDADLVLWARNVASSDPHGFYRSVARAGETFDEFEDRLARVLGGSEDEKDVAGLRKAITRRYLSAPGLSSKQRFDTQTGLPLTIGEAENLARRRVSVRKARSQYEGAVEDVERLLEQKASLTDPDERKALQKEIATAKRRLRGIRKRARFDDPEFIEAVLGENLGLDVKDLKGPYKDLVNKARLESAVTFGRRIELLGNLNDGRLATKVQMAKDAARTIQLNMLADQQRNSFFVKRFDLLTPGEKIQFNRLLSLAQDTGDYRKLAKLAKSNRRIGALVDVLEADPDKKVLRLFEESNHFRQNVLKAGVEAGVIEMSEFLDLVGPYAPHLFSTNEWRSMMGKVFDDPELFTKPTDLGLDLSELLRQKHLQKYKAAVYVKGGRKTTRLFDTQEAAEAWVRQEFGIRKSKTVKKFGAGAGVLEGETSLRDVFSILEPLGFERAQALGFLGEGASLFKRLDTLVRDIHQAAILKTFDRPGWAMTPEEYQRLILGPEGSKVAAQFTTTPIADIRSNGALRGKHVLKKIEPILEDVEFFTRTHERLEDVLKAKAEDAGLLSGLGLGSLALAVGSTRKLKHALVTNRITRAAKTIFYNFFMDSEMFGTTAAGRDFSIINPRSRQARQQAFDDLFAIMRSGDRRPSELYFEALEDGVIDDVLMMGTMEPQTRRLLNRIVYGTDPRKRGELSIATKWRRVLGGESDNPRIRKLEERAEQITEVIDTQRVPLAPEELAGLARERAAIQTILEGEVGTAKSQQILRAFREANDTFIGDKNLGTFRDTELLSRELYGRVSNLNRLAAYYHLRNKGFDRKLAVQRINTFMQHYSGVPNPIKRFGQKWYGSPIVAFPLEQMRITYNMMRYNPQAILAFLGGLGAANFMTMVAGGLDPYQVIKTMEQDSAGFPPLISFLSSLVVPHADGTFSSIQVPGLNFWQILREPFGVQREVFEVDDKPELDIPSALVNVATKFVMGQPTFQLAYSGAVGRDPRTGMKLHDRSQWMGRAVNELYQFFVPPELPIVGGDVRQVHEGIQRPAYMRTKRETSLAQRLIQSATGVRVRGQLGSGKLVGRAAEALATIWGVGVSLDPTETVVPIKATDTEGFGPKDLLAAIMVGTRELDPQNTETERFLDIAFQKMRKAVNFLESDDPEKQKFGERLGAEALQAFEEQLDGHSEFYSAEFRNRTEQEQIQLLARVLRGYDMDASFDRLSAVRRVGTLLGAITHGQEVIPDSQILAMLYKIQSQDNGRIRLYTSERSLQDAARILNDYLASPASNRFLPELQQLLVYLNFQVQRARFSQLKRQGRDELQRAAAEMLRRFGQ